MKKILIVEDEPLMQKYIQKVVYQHFPDFELLRSVSTVEDARVSIEHLEPDVVLLDISLPDGTAFDLLRKIELFDFKIVFISGNEDCLKEAIQFSAVSVISKPFDISELVLAIDKASSAVEEKDYQRKIEILLSNTDLPALDRMVVFPTVDTTQAVAVSSILYGEAIPGGCIMHLDSGKDIYVPRPLRRYEQLFANYSFFRCHPLYVVNLLKIESLDEANGFVYLEDGVQIPLEARKYELLKERFAQVGF